MIVDVIKNHTIIGLIGHKAKYFALGIKGSIDVAKQESYYPDMPRKSYIKRIADTVAWYLRNREVCDFYNAYGLDVVDLHKMEDYCDYRSFKRQRDELNGRSSLGTQTGLLRDKYAFYVYMTRFQLPVPEVFGICIEGKLYNENMKQVSIDELRGERDYFVKEIDGECASFVIHVNTYEDLKKYSEQILSRNCIFQRRMVQHKEMNRLNPNAVNTLRIVTVYNAGKPQVLTAKIRIGTKATGCVDNSAAGGISVGISKEGRLQKWGIRKPDFGGRVTSHPDTGVIFEEFIVPYYEQAVKLACEAHEKYYRVHSIGWDIAISEEGPVFIEGNDNWEMTAMQLCNGGLKEIWNSVIGK